MGSEFESYHNCSLCINGYVMGQPCPICKQERELRDLIGMPHTAQEEITTLNNLYNKL